MFGNKKILVYERMTSPINQLPMVIRNASDLVAPSPNGSMAEDHRFTTLENAVIDVIIAAHAKMFKATPYSSLSELVSMFNRIGRRERGWCHQ